MIPLKLSLSGFLSYQEPVEIDFTGIDLACISGPNGAGKSSLLDGITWVLFGQARKRDDAVVNTKSDTASVSFTFSYEGNVYRIQRVKPVGKTTVLEFHIQTGENSWKPLTERTMRATEERIRDTLRLDYETFVNASFFLQGKADQFTQQPPGDRKRILSSILGLEIWEVYRKQTVEERKVVESKIAELDGRLQEIGAELEEEGHRKKRLKELEGVLKTVGEGLEAQKKVVEEMRRRMASVTEQEKLVETLSKQVEKGRENLAEIKERLDNRSAEKESYSEVLHREKDIEAAYKTWEETKTELEKWNQTADTFHEQEQRRHAPLTQIETERARLETELDNLLEKQNTLKKGEAENKELEIQKKALEEEIEKINQRLAEREKLTAEREETIQRHSEAKGENPLLKAEMDDLKARIEKLESTSDSVCPTCGQDLTPKERENLIEELTKQGTQMGDKYRANQEFIQQVGETVKELEVQIKVFETVDREFKEKTSQLVQMETRLETFTKQKENWEKEGAGQIKEIEVQLKDEKFAQDARKTLTEIDKELTKIGYDVTSHDTLREKEKALRQVEVDLRQLESARAALTPLEREINDLNTQIKKEEKDLKAQETQYEDAVAALAVAQADAPDVGEAERKMLELQEEENKVRMEVGGARQEVNVLDTQKTRKKELEAEREDLARQVAQYAALERAFGKDGVPAMLIEQALPQIEIKANEILDRLTNGNMSIRFITQQAYKDKTREDLRETLDIQINDSVGQRDYEMFSGGEAFRINFAIRLALSEVLAQRAGARLQTLVVDEGFGSQDEMGRQRLVEAINMVKQDFELILVITHIDSLKDFFPTRLEVTKTAEGSKVDIN
ncbi:MAG: SMC family ATPase [Anaerolineales bacterium]|jgi:exonuclease SbcC